jgi:FkbM family methyltransferase
VKTVTHRFRHGPLHQLILPEGDRWTGRSVELYGEYSESEVDVFREFIRPDDVCVDAGALFGAHSLAMADLGALVHAFEPQEAARDILCENKHKSRILVYADALGAASGSARMTNEDHLGMNRISETLGTVEVVVSPLDAYKDDLDFLKIDVEGYEAQVLEGAEHLIRNCQPVIYLEFQENQLAIVRKLWEFGYRRPMTHRAPQDRFPNYNCVPLEKPYDATGPVMLLAVPEHRWKEHEGWVEGRFKRL